MGLLQTKMSWRTQTAALACIVAILVSGTATGATVDDLMKQGIQHFDLARFEESRRALELAQAATKDSHRLSRIYLYFGLIEAVSGSRTKARTMLVRALEQDPTLTLDPGRFKTDLVALFNEVRQGLRGALLVHTKQPSHAVYIDGKRVGQLPLLSNLPIGRHQVQVRTPDGRPYYSTTVVVRPHSTGKIPVGPGPRGLVAPEHTVADKDHRPEKKTTRRRRVFTWIAAGTAVVMLGTGIGLGVSSNRGNNEWEAGCKQNQLYTDCDELALSVENRDLAANVMFAVGGSLAVSAVLLYFFEGRVPGEARRGRKRTASSTLVTPLVGRSVVGGSLSLSF